MTDEQAKHLMAHLVDANPGKAIAFMQVKKEATTTVEWLGYTRTDQVPYSHITLLYQALLTKFSRKKATDEKLYSSIPPSDMCKGMAKVLDAYAPVHSTGGAKASVEAELVSKLVSNDPAG